MSRERDRSDACRLKPVPQIQIKEKTMDFELTIAELTLILASRTDADAKVNLRMTLECPLLPDMPETSSLERMPDTL